ncbi:MAG: tyrosine-type recombinase/integrase [Dehalococcoidales bacterium]
MPASPKTGLSTLLQGYCLCAQSEGKSPKTIEMVRSSVGYLAEFLYSQGMSTNVADIGTAEIRMFIVHLQRKKPFSNHPFARPQQRALSEHTVNCYLRSVRAFWSWLVSEAIIKTNPFSKIKIPKVSRKIVPTLSELQLRALLEVINVSSPEGYRDMAVILLLVDTGLRVSELASLRLQDLRLAEGALKVLGKGNKERLVPIGKTSQRLLWNYLNRFRSESASPRCQLVFLTDDGWPLTKNRIQKMIAKYGKKASIQGVRCSPHTLRHTAAVMFLRNGGNVFSLQRLLGHAGLEMTRHYCELADIDVKTAHSIASPVDNLGLRRHRVS